MRPRAQLVALCLVVVAVVPYTALKILWLAGGSMGLESGAAATELHSTRMVVGNVVTIVLELAAVGLAIALVRPWGRRVPGWVVVVLAGGATGLLAPILLGLSVGSVLQLALTGELRTGGMDDMSPWVFALAYGGFALLAVGIAVLAGHYALDRWGHLLGRPPLAPGGRVTLVGAVGLLPFGATMVWWGLLGPGESGPEAMDAVSQRTVLAISGLLAIAAWLAPLARGAAARRPGAAWLLTWVGCTTAALQSPTQVLLANRGEPTPALLVLVLLTLPGSTAYGLSVLRRRLAEVEEESPVHVSARVGP